MTEGLIHAYYGNGKGKTTAALGLGLRAAGSGLSVIMIQFLKTSDTGELHSAVQVEGFTIQRFESPHGFYRALDASERKQLQLEVTQAFQEAGRLAREAGCDLLILDECFGAMEKGLISEAEALQLIREKDPKVELVFTGRVLPEALRPYMDYITCMEAEKHPFEKGIAARKGIEY